MRERRNLEALRMIPAQLKSRYKNDNPQRLDFINFTCALAEHPDINESVLLGAFVLELEIIGREYAWSQRIGILPTRSTVYDFLQSELQMNEKNLLSDAERLMYLIDFYDFVQKHTPNDPILTELASIMRYVLSPHFPSVMMLAERLPPAEKLLDNILLLAEKYKKIVEGRWLSNATSREHQIKFLTTIVEKLKDDNSEKCASICFGALLVVSLLVQIEYETGWTGTWFRKPKHSEFYELCRKAFNVASFSHIPENVQIHFLEAIKAFILANPALKSILPNVDKLINKRLYELTPIEPTHSVAEQWLGHYAARGLAWGVTLGAAELAPSTIPVVLAGDTISFSLGCLAAGPVGGVVAQQLGRVATAGILYFLLNKFADKIGATAARAVTVTVSTSVDGVKGLLGFMTKELGVEIDQRFEEALLKLPSGILDPDIHERIIYTSQFAPSAPSPK